MLNFSKIIKIHCVGSKELHQTPEMQVTDAWSSQSLDVNQVED